MRSSITTRTGLYSGDFPSNAELLEARNWVFARHRKTNFVVLHVGNFGENLANVAENLDCFPNITVERTVAVCDYSKFGRRSLSRIVPTSALQKSSPTAAAPKSGLSVLRQARIEVTLV